MSYAQGTTHYNFPQIVGTDRPTFADANEAFRTLDTKLFSLEADSTDLDTRLDTAEGNIVQLQNDVQTAQGTANQAKAKADTNAESIQLMDITLSQHSTQIANKLDSVAIADPYDPTNTYAIDDIVTYNGQRWRCTTAVTVGEPFDVSKWIGEDVQTVIDELKSDLFSKVGFTTTSAETYGSVLNRLASLIDYNKSNARSVLQIGQRFYHIARKDGANLYFSQTMGTQLFYAIPVASASVYQVDGVDKTTDALEIGTIVALYY